MAEDYGHSTRSQNEKSLPSRRIHFMEKSLKEMETVLKLFADGGQQGDLPSWKYPHRKLKDLEMGQIFKQLDRVEMSEERRYAHLVELCIDRLYYSLLTIVRNLNLLSNRFYADETKMISNIHTNLNHFQHQPINISNGSVRMAQLVQQITAYFPLIEGSILVSQDKTAHPKTNVRTVAVPKQLHIQTQSDNTKDVATQIQGESHRSGCCKSCSDIGDAVRAVGDTLEKCLRAVSKDNAGTIRLKMGRDMTQWEVLTHSCDEIRNNCSSIVQHVGKNLQNNLILESTIADVKSRYDKHGTQCDKFVKRMQWKILEMTKELQSERDSIRETQVDIGKMEARCLELKERLCEETETTPKNTVEKNDLKEARENLNQRLIKSNQNLAKIEFDLKLKEKVNEDLHMAIHTFQELKKAEEDEIKKKFKTTSYGLRSAKSQNACLRKMIPIVKKEIQCIQDKRTEDDKRRAEAYAKIDSLQTRLKDCKSKFKLLRMYPDLNGPVNPPSLDDQDIVETMKRQVFANEERVQVLKLENLRLADTIRKMKIHSNKT